MRTTIIPAQITTVEDRIAGNLTLLQMVLLIVPLVVGVVIYALLPPPTTITAYKIALIFFTVLLILPLAIRIRGKILFDWLIVISRYHARPRYYLYNKNDVYMRPIYKEEKIESVEEAEQEIETEEETVEINPLAALQFDQLFQAENLKLGLKANRKGGLDVAIYQTE